MTVFDIDGDGFITRDEIRRVMASMGERLTEEEIENMLLEADADGNGRIDYDGMTSLALGRVLMLISRHIC